MGEIVKVSDNSFELLVCQASFRGFVDGVHGNFMTMVAVDDENTPIANFVIDVTSSRIRSHSSVPIVAGHPFTWERSEQGGVVIDDIHFDQNFYNYNGWITRIDDDTFTVLIHQGRYGLPFSWNVSKRDVKPVDLERIVLGYGIGCTSLGKELKVSDIVFTEPKFTPDEITEIQSEARELFSFFVNDAGDGENDSDKLSSM